MRIYKYDDKTKQLTPQRMESVDSKTEDTSRITGSDKTTQQQFNNSIGAMVSKLVGNDSNKSVREISAEEIAEQLIPENANASLDILQEIAAWIQDHPEDAAAINNRLMNLEDIVPQPLSGDQDKVLFGDGTWGGVIDFYEYASRQDHVISNASGIPNVAIRTGDIVYIAVDNDNYDIGPYVLTGANVDPPYSVFQSHLVRLSNSKNPIFGEKNFGSAGNAIVAGLVPPIPYSEKDSGKVLQPTGWGKKLQADIVVQNGAYGYINSNNEFVPFRSQTDIDAAVAAARVGTATAADVLSGKTFTNTSGSGLVGTLQPLKIATTKCSPSKNLNQSTWIAKTWNGLTNIDGGCIWTDGDNIYYSGSSTQAQYVLNKETSTWTAKTWNGLTNFSGYFIWTDGDNIYYSNKTSHYVLNKSTSTWTAKTWNGLTNFNGTDLWTDGDNIYYSRSMSHYVLNKSTSTWTAKTWSGLTNLHGSDVWTDGDNIYYSDGYGVNYVLNKSTSTWSTKTWNGKTSFNGNNIWTDGNNIYYTDGPFSYDESWVLNKSTSTWSTKTWNGLDALSGCYIWTDGNNIYFSNGSRQYVLTKKFYIKT